MSSAQHLSVLDPLCSRPFPAQRDGSPTAAQYGGPGYLIRILAEFTGTEEHWDTSPYQDLLDQCEAEREALAQLLGDRHGPAGEFPLQGVLLRTMEYGEEMDEPWASLSGHVEHLYLWRLESLNRWLGLGTSRMGEELPPRLLAVVTETDPP
ncbi:hypothetical protein HUT18_01960 [Streptomyces sp. NA04227]|uniref:hypothetical protein n=1 Tax=Streptomyces sp. NA04227 TaxID=2742136 RepID=UPI001590EC83|nr:hypothetical protein [Streptomyces sp. NA04227]QKW05318.1 hypothetical protein HUT18_01960 [Streptomyces sp. NA04227]